MKVIKCDICGKYCNDEIEVNIKWYDMKTAHNKSMNDLCEDCYEKLIDVLVETFYINEK